MPSDTRYLIEAEHLSYSFESGLTSSFNVANKVYKRWQSDPWVSSVRLMKCTDKGRERIDI